MGNAYIWASISTDDRDAFIQSMLVELGMTSLDKDIWDADEIDAVEMSNILRRLSLRFDRHRVTIILQADHLSPLVQSKLLKPIEELTEDHSILLVTDKPAALDDTLRSRCIEHRSAATHEPEGGPSMIQAVLDGSLADLFSFTASRDADQVHAILKALDALFQARVLTGTISESLISRWIAERTRCEAFASRVTMEALMLTTRKVLNHKETQR